MKQLLQEYGEWENNHRWVCPVLWLSDILFTETYSLDKVIRNGCGVRRSYDCRTCPMRSVK